ncbi:hypothetical protein NEOLEDRAFT_1179498 [Neolentinus lepideus HHB14362 ss-1]|uniref:Hemerythrin-like domain-containing protein n=1 Tax=Neolentinus lepideus HHB14362 ss-1 TaxID=1314782 RepID=A0A165RTJ4_9AGAM|nr:hypothetical protein NEOLEDRAFT_1179498 [Neolentinus lepideus HHB14362 ss-1]
MSDVLATIKADHDNVKSLFGKYKAATGSEKVTLAMTLITEMKAHSAAERVLASMDDCSYTDPWRSGMPPSTLTTPAGVSTLLPTSVKEHAEINKMLADAAAAASNDAVVTKAVTTFIAHSDEEENQQWPAIKAKMSASESATLATQFVAAKKSVA